MNDKVIINLAMLKIGDKVKELEEIHHQQRILLAELKDLMQDWVEVLR